MSFLSLVRFHLMNFFSFWRKEGNERSNFFFIFQILKRGFHNSGNPVLNSFSLSTALIFFDFFLYENPFSKFRKWKKKLLLSLPYSRQYKKKILSNKHWEKWTKSRAWNGVVPETMYGMSRCIWNTLYIK